MSRVDFEKEYGDYEEIEEFADEEDYRDESRPSSKVQPKGYSELNQLQTYLQTRKSVSTDWRKDFKLVAFFKSASVFFFKLGFNQIKFINILLLHRILPEIMSTSSLVKLWCQEEIFSKDLDFIERITSDIIKRVKKPYLLVSLLTEGKDDNTLNDIWKKADKHSHHHLSNIFFRIKNKSLCPYEALSIIKLFQQKGYFDFNRLDTAISVICGFIVNSTTCDFAEFVLAQLNIEFCFTLSDKNMILLINHLIIKYHSTQDREYKIRISYVMAMIPAAGGPANLALEYYKEAVLVITQCLEWILLKDLRLLVLDYLNPKPTKKVDPRILSNAANYDQILLSNPKRVKKTTDHRSLTTDNRILLINLKK